MYVINSISLYYKNKVLILNKRVRFLLSIFHDVTRMQYTTITIKEELHDLTNKRTLSRSRLDRFIVLSSIRTSRYSAERVEREVLLNEVPPSDPLWQVDETEVYVTP